MKLYIQMPCEETIVKTPSKGAVSTSLLLLLLRTFPQPPLLQAVKIIGLFEKFDNPSKKTLNI